MLRPAVAVAVLCMPSLLVAQQGKELRPPRLEAPHVIDGELDEPAWQQAARADGFFQFRPVDSRPAEDSTVVLVWYSPEALHIGIRAYDRDPASVRATLSDRDNIGSDDAVTIYLDTFNDQRRAYFFGVNPYGVQDDGVRAEGGFSASSGGSGTTDRNPDFIWQSKGRKTDFGWQAELRIPFKTLRWNPGDVQSWGFNVARITQRTQYEDTWTDVRRANASFLVQAGQLVNLEGIRRGVVTELQPTVVADFPGRRTADGGFDRSDVRHDVGLNFRFGFTALTLDGTINPDFSQVESDVGLVTINERFALFFPERRPFFLEGIDLFASPNNLVYTRTVANPLGGAKLTGKFGRWSVAHLTAIDEFQQAPGLPADTKALANITRLRRDVGENSIAGITLTNRDEDGSFNRVASADARLVFAKLYYVQAQAAYAVTRDTRTTDDRTAALWEVEVDRTGRAWGFNYKATEIGRDFTTWSGFVNRTGIVTARAFNRLSFYGDRGALIEQFSVFGGVSRIWESGRLLGERSIEGGDELNWSMRLRGGWNLGGSVENGFVRFDPTAYAGYAVRGIDTPAPFAPGSGVFDALQVNANVSTPLFRRWDASLRTEYGETAIFPEASQGTGVAATATVNLRPSPAVRVSGSLRYQRLDRADEGGEFARTVLPRLKVEYQPNRFLFFRLVAEYRSERQAALRDPVSGLPLLVNGTLAARRETNRLRMDWLASYEPTPGTVAFIGYGSTLNGERPLSFRELERQDDAFFLKVAYLLRR
ncbi:MAG TPA: DUF5916 domain-containing protein [Gemmatimonadales bacterium]|nr:DUF5916 domain-containing protein [Gemmatimonadales bacterium]